MKKRIITGALMAIILVPAIIVPACKPIFEALVILFTVIASFEILNMYDKEKKLPLELKIISAVLTIGLYAAVVNNFGEVCSDTFIYKITTAMKFDFDVFTSLGIIFLVLMVMMILVPEFDAADVGKFLIQEVYVGLCFASFTVLRQYGVRFIIYLLTVTVCTDVFALVFGLTLGRKFGHKMAPVISPKKTWEGAIGGTAVALIVGFFVLYFYPYYSPIFHGGENVAFFEGVFEHAKFTKTGMIFFMLILTLFMSICSQMGDLVASKLKRRYGIKDYSNIFPGHGGVLDRFDSAMFVSAIFLVFLQLEALTFSLLPVNGII